MATEAQIDWYKSQLDVNGVVNIGITDSEALPEVTEYLYNQGKRFLFNKVQGYNAIEIRVVTPIQEVNSFVAQLNERIAQLEQEKQKWVKKVEEVEAKINTLKAQRDNLFTS